MVLFLLFAITFHLCHLGETVWFDLELIAKLKKTCAKIFPVVDYAYVSIPTYIGGQIGFLLNSKNKDAKFQVCLPAIL